jgi:hypothetical protein
MQQDPTLPNQTADSQKSLVTKLINHYEPNVDVTDDYYKSISEKYQDVDTLVTKLINHYEPDSEVTTDYLDGLYVKYGVKKKESAEPTVSTNGSKDLQATQELPSIPSQPLAGLGGGAVKEKAGAEQLGVTHAFSGGQQELPYTAQVNAAQEEINSLYEPLDPTARDAYYSQDNIDPEIPLFQQGPFTDSDDRRIQIEGELREAKEKGQRIRQSNANDFGVAVLDDQLPEMLDHPIYRTDEEGNVIEVQDIDAIKEELSSQVGKARSMAKNVFDNPNAWGRGNDMFGNTKSHGLRSDITSMNDEDIKEAQTEFVQRNEKLLNSMSRLERERAINISEGALRNLFLNEFHKEVASKKEKASNLAIKEIENSLLARGVAKEKIDANIFRRVALRDVRKMSEDQRAVYENNELQKELADKINATEIPLRINEAMDQYDEAVREGKALRAKLGDDQKQYVNMLTGNHVDKVTNDEETDITEAVNAKKEEYKSLRTNVEDLYVKASVRDNEHREYGKESKRDITISQFDFGYGPARDKLRRLGYEEKRNAQGNYEFKNVSLSDLAMPIVLQGLYKEDQEDPERWAETNRENIIERVAAKDMALLNIDFGKVEKDVGFFMERGVEILGQETIGAAWTNALFGENYSNRALIDAAIPMLKEHGIEITEEQEKNLERTLGEEISEGTFAMAPFVAKIVAIGAILGPIAAEAGLTETIAVLSRGNSVQKVQSAFLQASYEEILMQASGLDPLTGAGFSGTRSVLKAAGLAKSPLRFAGALARGNKALDAVWTSGISGAVAAEGASNAETIVRDFEGSTTYKEFIEENYSDISQVSRRIFVNAAVFTIMAGKELTIGKGSTGFSLRRMEEAKSEFLASGREAEANQIGTYISEIINAEGKAKEAEKKAAKEKVKSEKKAPPSDPPSEGGGGTPETKTEPTKEKGRLHKNSTGTENDYGYIEENGKKRILTKDEYLELEKQEGVFDVEGDVEKRRKAELDSRKYIQHPNFKEEHLVELIKRDKNGTEIGDTKEDVEKRINDKYDAEIASEKPVAEKPKKEKTQTAPPKEETAPVVAEIAPVEETVAEEIDLRGEKAVFTIKGEEIEVEIPKRVSEAASEMDAAQRAKAEEKLRQQAHDKYNEEIKSSESKTTEAPIVVSEGKVKQEDAPVKVKSFKKGEGGTAGVLESEDGKLYKSAVPHRRDIVNGKVEIVPVEGKETQEHKFLSENQDMKHLPKVGEVVETSEGKAFEIEKLNEVKEGSLTLEEINQVQETLKELNGRGVEVADNNTVMRRDNGEIVLVDLSSAQEFRKGALNETVSSNVVDLLNKNDKTRYLANKRAKHESSSREIFNGKPKPKTEFTYLLTQRPPSIGTHPEGQIRDAEPTTLEGGKRTAYKITYDRPLTEKEIKSYELTEDITENDIGRQFERVSGSSPIIKVITNVSEKGVEVETFLGGKSKVETVSRRKLQRELEGSTEIKDTPTKEGKSEKVSESETNKEAASEADVIKDPIVKRAAKGFLKIGTKVLANAKALQDFVNELTGKGVKGRYNITMPDGSKKQVQPSSPEVVNGFYSPLEKIISGAKQDKMPSKQWIDKFARGEEAKWTGLTEWLEAQEGSVTKAEIQKFLKDNRIEVVEVVKDDKAPDAVAHKKKLADFDAETKKIYDKTRDLQDQWEEKRSESRLLEASDPKDKVLREEMRTIQEEKKRLEDIHSKRYFERVDIVQEQSILSQVNDKVRTKYKQQQLEGEKTDYKEILVTMPSGINENRLKQLIEKKREGLTTDAEEAEFDKIDSQSAKNYHSSHWDEPNILVHVRMNTRTDADGKKVLFLEEVQSDHGQDAKKKGFIESEAERKEIAEKKFKEAKEKSDAYLDALDEKYGSADLARENMSKDEQAKVQRLIGETANLRGEVERVKSGVPQAPFVTDTNAWVKLGLKVALKEAQKQGVDKIAWTTGEQQNARYDLSKQVDAIDYSYRDGKYSLFIDKNGSEVGKYEDLNESQLEDYVGKEVAQKIINKEGKKGGDTTRLSGLDLKVGGKGMKGFYGSPAEGSLGIVGNVAKKLFKQTPKTTGIKSTDPNRLINAEMKLETKKDVVDSFEQKIKESKDKGNTEVLRELLADAKKEVEIQQSIVDGEINHSQQHSIDLTPELKAEAQQGQPLFHYNEKGEILGVSYKDPVTGKNKMALNGEKITAKTTFEEMGHTWINWSKDVRPDLHEAGLKKVGGSRYLKEVMADKNYQAEALKQGKKGSAEYNAYMAEEALAKAIADNGAKFVTGAKKAGFKDWVMSMWRAVAEQFGIQSLTPKEIGKLTLDEFSKKAAADVFAREGKPEKKTDSKLTPEEAKEKLKSLNKKREELVDNLEDLTEIDKQIAEAVKNLPEEDISKKEFTEEEKSEAFDEKAAEDAKAFKEGHLFKEIEDDFTPISIAEYEAANGKGSYKENKVNLKGLVTKEGSKDAIDNRDKKRKGEEGVEYHNPQDILDYIDAVAFDVAVTGGTKYNVPKNRTARKAPPKKVAPPVKDAKDLFSKIDEEQVEKSKEDLLSWIDKKRAELKDETRPRSQGFGIPDNVLDKAYEMLGKGIEANGKIAEIVVKVLKFIDDNVGAKWDRDAFLKQIQPVIDKVNAEKEYIPKSHFAGFGKTFSEAKRNFQESIGDKTVSISEAVDSIVKSIKEDKAFFRGLPKAQRKFDVQVEVLKEIGVSKEDYLKDKSDVAEAKLKEAAKSLKEARTEVSQKTKDKYATAGYRIGEAFGKLAGEIRGKAQGRKEGVKLGAKQQKKLAEEVSAIVKNLVAELKTESPNATFSQKQIRSAVSTMLKVNFNSPLSFERAVEKMEKILSDAEYDQALSDINSMKSKAKKLAKKSGIPSNHVEALNEIANVDMSMVEDVKDFKNKVEEYMRTFLSPTHKNYKQGNSSDIINHIDSVLSDGFAREKKRMAEAINKEAGKDLGLKDSEIEEIYDSIFTKDEHESILDHLSDKDKKKGEELLATLGNILQQALKTTEIKGLNLKDKAVIKTLLDADLSKVPKEVLAEYIRFTDNLIENGSMSGIYGLAAKVKATIDMKEAVNATKDIKKYSFWKIGKLTPMDIFQSVSDVFKNIFGYDSHNKGAASKVMALSGFTSAQSGYAKKYKSLKEYTDKAEKLYQSLSAEASSTKNRMAEFVVSKLIQPTSGMEPIDSVNRWRELIKQHIEETSTSSETKKESEILKEVLAEFDSAKTPEEVLSILKEKYPENYKVIDFFIKENESNKEKFKEHDEKFHNGNSEWDNPYHMPIIFQKSPKSKYDVKDDLYDRNEPVKPKRQKNAIKRQVYKNLPNGKVFNTNVRRNHSQVLSDNLGKLYSDEGWMRVSSFLNSPEAAKLFGGEDNLNLVKDRLSHVQKTHKGATYDPDALNRFLMDATNRLRRVGSKYSLAGFGQFFKQAPDQFVNAATHLGLKDSALLARYANPISAREGRILMDKFPIGLRASNVGGTKFDAAIEADMGRLQEYLSNGNLDKARRIYDKWGDMLYGAMKASDLWATQASWLAAYEGYLTNKGKRLYDWEMESELVEVDNIRMEAAQYAENLVNMTQGPSDVTQLSRVARKSDTWAKNGFKMLYAPFAFTRSQHWSRVMGDVMDIRIGRDRYRASKSLFSTVVGMGVFNAVSIYVMDSIIKGGGNLIVQALTGLDPDDENEEEKKKNAKLKLKEWYSRSIVQSTTPPMLSDQFEKIEVDAVNAAYYIMMANLGDESLLDKNGKMITWEKFKKSPELTPMVRYGQERGDKGVNQGYLDVMSQKKYHLEKSTKAVIESLEKDEDELRPVVIASALSEYIHTVGLMDKDVNRMFREAANFKGAPTAESELKEDKKALKDAVIEKEDVMLSKLSKDYPKEYITATDVYYNTDEWEGIVEKMKENNPAIERGDIVVKLKSIAVKHNVKVFSGKAGKELTSIAVNGTGTNFKSPDAIAASYLTKYRNASKISDQHVALLEESLSAIDMADVQKYFEEYKNK